jgi:3-hydroxyacyl-CoA dehydrogenase/enoyl-CoA hydratase/3-hydroxybutyryl-CoA epimerase
VLLLKELSEVIMPAFTLERNPDGIAVLTFDLPGEKVNKLTSAVMDELDRLLDNLRAETAIKALIIRSGKPDTFIAGADIAEIRDITDRMRGEELSRKGQAVFRKLEDLPFPTVAAIHGPCLGGGLELALACRHRVVSTDPKTVLGLPEVRLGIIPGFGGTQRLPRLVGLSRSLEMILTGRTVPGRKAAAAGLADEAVNAETLPTAAVEAVRNAIGHRRPSGVRGRRPLLVRLLESNPLSRLLVYRKAERAVLADTRGNYPAPLAALDAVRTGLRRGTQQGSDREATLIGDLIATGVSKNLIHVYYLGEALKRSDAPPPGTVRQTGVIGAGAMGSGIAQLFAEKGIAVMLQDVSPKAVGAGYRSAASLFAKRSARGILDPLAARNGMDRITPTVSWDGFSSIDIAVEAVVESMDVKQQMLREFELRANERAIFASNTSSLSITGLASAARRPDRVVGMHFFNPVEKMPLVEIVRGRQTAPETVAAVAALARRLGKLPVVVNDGPGFLVNRILMPYLAEALQMLEEGGSIEEIDEALMRFGMPLGAFALLDEIGIDVAAKVSRVLQQGLGGRLPESRLLETLSGGGYLGKKNEKGFYRYLRGLRGGHEPAVYAMMGKDRPAVRLSPEEVVERTVLLMIKEAALCLEEGIIGRADLLDAALIFGLGFPPFRGGLLRYADSLGAKRITEKLSGYEQRFGSRFAPPQSLAEMSRDDFITQVVSR